MKLHQIKQTFRNYYTLNNIVSAVALLLAASLLWGTVQAMQNNFQLQHQVDVAKQNVEVLNLEAQNLAYENNYYASNEYLDLAVRERFGKAPAGESMLLLPPNTVHDTRQSTVAIQHVPQPSNFQAWMDFLFGQRQ